MPPQRRQRPPHCPPRWKIFEYPRRSLRGRGSTEMIPCSCGLIAGRGGLPRVWPDQTTASKAVDTGRLSLLLRSCTVRHSSACRGVLVAIMFLSCRPSKERDIHGPLVFGRVGWLLVRLFEQTMVASIDVAGPARGAARNEAIDGRGPRAHRRDASTPRRPHDHIMVNVNSGQGAQYCDSVCD